MADEVFELDVTLLDVEPQIWRRVAVAADSTLAELHPVIQTVMGWRDEHLHHFISERGIRFTRREAAVQLDSGLADAADSAQMDLRGVLRRLGDRVLYEYDFGDGWEHRIELVAIRPREQRERLPRCLAGERACPPENSGGSAGYSEVLDALTDTGHERHAELRRWVGSRFDAEACDIAAVNRRLLGSARN